MNILSIALLIVCAWCLVKGYAEDKPICIVGFFVALACLALSVVRGS